MSYCNDIKESFYLIVEFTENVLGCKPVSQTNQKQHATYPNRRPPCRRISIPMACTGANGEEFL